MKRWLKTFILSIIGLIVKMIAENPLSIRKPPEKCFLSVS